MTAAFWNLALPSMVVLSSIVLTITAYLQGQRRALRVFKFITFALIISVALVGVEALYDKRGLLVLAGLLASLFGDVLASKRHTYALIFFAAAALAYTVAFLTGFSAGGLISIGIALAILGLSLVVFWRDLENRSLRLVYAAVLLAMTFQATERYLLIANLGTLLALLGALLLCLSFFCHVLAHVRAGWAVLYLFCFYVAQWCFALHLHLRFT